MIHVLYNPLANNKTGEKCAHEYLDQLIDSGAKFIDITTVDNLGEYVEKMTADDKIILAGGDGTIYRFINEVSEDLPCEVDYVPTGSGNDFKKDVGGDKIIPLNKYVKDLPTVTINGKTSKFINGVGCGIDGYCCEVGDELKKKSDKPINYGSIAVKGLLFHFKPVNATVTVDGEEHTYKKCWIIPTMKGAYYGGGMRVAPEQDRLAEDGKVSLVVWHGSGKLKTLTSFPGIFKGTHVKHKKIIDIYRGHEITVKVDRPIAVQIDGETVLGVTEYSVSTGKK